jgi:hypothetical protein
MAETEELDSDDYPDADADSDRPDLASDRRFLHVHRILYPVKDPPLLRLEEPSAGMRADEEAPMVLGAVEPCSELGCIIAGSPRAAWNRKAGLRLGVLAYIALATDPIVDAWARLVRRTMRVYVEAVSTHGDVRADRERRFRLLLARLEPRPPWRASTCAYDGKITEAAADHLAFRFMAARLERLSEANERPLFLGRTINELRSRKERTVEDVAVLLPGGVLTHLRAWFGWERPATKVHPALVHFVAHEYRNREPGDCDHIRLPFVGGTSPSDWK